MFGFEPYHVPVEEIKYRIQNSGMPKLKRVIEFEKVALKNKKYPGPDHYAKQANWDKNFPLKQGQFLKKKRETFTSQTMREMKKTVGPNRYTVKEDLVKPAITGNYTQ